MTKMRKTGRIYLWIIWDEGSNL